MMKQDKKSRKGNLKAFRGSTWRRLRSTPSYFFLIWRWSMWIYALVIVIGVNQGYQNRVVYMTTVYLLIITFVQTAIVTLYAPVVQILFPHRGRQALIEDEETDILPPLVRTKNPYWNIAVYGLDVIICGLVIYYSGPFGGPPNFGISSPFYRYGMSTVFAASLAYQYRGGLAAALGFDLFMVFGMLFPAPGSSPYQPNIIDITACLIDTPVIAILIGYVADILMRLTNSRHALQQNTRIIQDSVRREAYLRSIMESIMRLSQERQQMLQKSIEQTRAGGHFYAVTLCIPPMFDESDAQLIEPAYLEARVTGYKTDLESRKMLEEVVRSGQKYVKDFSDRDGIACLYLPFLKNGRVLLVLGAESRQGLSGKDEIFLTTVGAQLQVALENMYLAEQTVQLAAAAERGRLARELHDGVAQLIYMLSLNAETCAAQAQRILEASEEDAELIAPLAERLEKLVKITKQALWETRTYMFSLKPLMSGDTTLTQMLANQLREFETISGLTTGLEIVREEGAMEEVGPSMQRKELLGTALFRIVQEALTNAYKHAGASQVHVRLSMTTDSYLVEISDDGCGLQQVISNGDGDHASKLQHIYSGYGLRGMRERVQELGGSLEISQSESGGVKVQANLPI